MKKKVLSAILSVAMVASLIVGCGAKEEAAAPAAECEGIVYYLNFCSNRGSSSRSNSGGSSCSRG